MKTSQAGIELIQRFEGCRLKAYPDPATGGDPWTVGYGHTGDDVRPGLEITAEGATALLQADLGRFEACVMRWVNVPLKQCQFDALVSFAFNCGCGSLQSSTLLKLLNIGNYSDAAKQFARWNKAAGKEMPGLTRRRAAEAAMFMGGGE